MPQPYNLTAFSLANNPVQMTTEANTLSGGLFGIGVLFLIFVALFMHFKNTGETKKSFAGASLICSIVVIPMRLMSWVNDTWMFGMFIIGAISLAVLLWGE